MAHLFNKDVQRPNKESYHPTGFGDNWNFQVSYNSDGRIVLRFYEKDDDGKLIQETYVNLDSAETQELKAFIGEIYD